MDGAELSVVLNKLRDLLERQVGLIAGAEDEITTLRDDLSLLTSVLEGITNQSEGNNIWSDNATTSFMSSNLKVRLRRVSWKVDDVVDQYLLDVAQHESKTFVKNLFSKSHKVLWKRHLAKEARAIKGNIEYIITNKDLFLPREIHLYRPVQQIGENALDHKEMLNRLTENVDEEDEVGFYQQFRKAQKKRFDRRWRGNFDEEDVVGFDRQFSEVMEMLRLEACDQTDQLRVVSIIGMGGIGKTTLARKIFNSEKMINFDTKLWVAVSEHVDGKHVLKNILRSLKVNIENDDNNYLKGRLKKQLDGRKYLIILDDLWTPKQWEEVKSYLPTDEYRGSRILLTSRIEMANAANPDSAIYRLKPLGDEDSWRLFCTNVFKGEDCPSNLKYIGKDMVSRCRGLPLALTVLAGSLSVVVATTHSLRYSFETLRNKIGPPYYLLQILSVCYQNLPPHLKTCFLYIGVFPKDFEILAKDLCLMWVAEGFVKGRGTELEEDLAKEYLINLVDRNLVMISKRKSDGSIKSCRIHDLLRDLCIKEAQRYNLYKVNVDGASQNVEEGVVRRLTNHNSYSITPLPPPLYKGLRTLLDFSMDNSSDLRSAYEHLSVTRVLHLHLEEDNRKAPISIKNLILLRYLKVHLIGQVYLSQILMMTPKSKTSNLQVLNLESRHHTINLPEGIWKLELLRHINVRPAATLPDAGSWDDSLPHLQTLSCIIYEDHTSKMLCTKRFPNLRKLYMNVCPDNPLSAESLRSLPGLLHLLALKITFEHVSLFLGEPLFSVSVNIVALPSAITKVHLNNTALTSDHWSQLGKLKNLKVLKLSTNGGIDTDCEEKRFLNQPLVFKAEAFPQLLHLKLKTSHRDLIMEDGALRTLEYFIIGCRHIEDLGVSALPDQLWLLSTLIQVKIINPSHDLNKYISSLDASTCSKIIISNKS
uniref:Uncharacterized protein n=1 Tax=Kalanchoe fedtschenkoi TaxID=63787 RepID=A0A7N0V9L6_KALFE